MKWILTTLIIAVLLFLLVGCEGSLSTSIGSCEVNISEPVEYKCNNCGAIQDINNKRCTECGVWFVGIEMDDE